MRNSDFYLSLDDAEDEPISIPSNCAKFSLQLNPDEFTDDLRILLNTFRFWGVNRLLYIADFTTFIVTVKDKPLCRNVLSEFEAELTELRVLIKTLEKNTKEEALCAAISAGEFELVKIMAANKYTFNQSCVVAAAQHNRVDCLEFALSKGCDWEQRLMNVAAKQGHVEILKFADERGLKRGFEVCASAAKGGHLFCLQYAYENGHTWKEKVCPVHNLPIVLYARSIGAAWPRYTCCEAARLGSLDVLQYLHQGHDYAYPIHKNALLMAVWMGHTDCVRYLQSIDIPWTGGECALAAYRGHLDTLKYLLECGCTCEQLTCWVCSVHDQVECLQYLHESGCPWDCTTPCAEGTVGFHSKLFALYIGSINHIEKMEKVWFQHDPFVGYAIMEKPVDCDIFHGCEDSHSFGIAQVCTHYKANRCLQYASAQGCAWSDNLFPLSTNNSEHESVRRCICEHCQPWSAQTCAKAALCRNVDHLQFLHEHGCPWDKETVMNALTSEFDASQLPQLDDEIAELIKPSSDFSCLRYAVQHHCPYEIEEVRAIIAGEEFYRTSEHLREIFPWIEEDERDAEYTRLGRKRLFFCTGAMLALAVTQVSMRAIGLLRPK